VAARYPVFYQFEPEKRYRRYAPVARPVTPAVVIRPYGVTAVVSSTFGDLLMPLQHDGSTAVPARHSIEQCTSYIGVC